MKLTAIKSSLDLTFYIEVYENSYEVFLDRGFEGVGLKRVENG